MYLVLDVTFSVFLSVVYLKFPMLYPWGENATSVSQRFRVTGYLMDNASGQGRGDPGPWRQSLRAQYHAMFCQAAFSK